MDDSRSTPRRALLSANLATVGAALAGCLGAVPGNRGDGNGGDEDDGTGNGDDVLATAAIEAVAREDVPPVALDVELRDAAVTPVTPATLRTEVRNALDVPVTVGESRSVRFDLARSEAGGSELIPLPSTDALDRDASDCWRLYDGAPLERLAVHETRTLDPGESFGLTLEVWWDGDGECFPTGTFAFETRVGYEARDGRYRDGDGSPSESGGILHGEGRLGFELVIESGASR